MGFPSGIPAKIEDGGIVRSRRASTLDYFTADTDTFGGNSGSGVFNDNGLLVGILVRGATDYVYDGGSGCYRANRISSGASASEDSSYAFQAVSELCSAGYVGDLCGNAPSAPDAGGTVDTGSDGGIPSSWACNSSYYDANDGCDCGCGAIDPDCSLSGQTLYGCEEGQVCGATGVCEAPATEEPSQGDGWTCNPSYYNANDGCDCDCGIPDPDCERSNQRLYNCEAGRPATMPVNAKQPGNVIPPTTMRTMAVIAVVVFPTLTATSQDNDFTAVLAVSRATMRGYASRESLWGTRRHSLRGRAVVANSQTYESSRGSCSSRAHRPICLRYTAILAGFLLPENQGQGRG